MRVQYCPTVDTVDDEITPVIEFVGKALPGDAAYDRGPGPCRPDDVEVPLLPRERPLHGSDDVSALTHRSEHRLRLRVDAPDAGGRLLGKPHALKMLQSAHHVVPFDLGIMTPLTLAQINNPLDQLRLNRTVDAGPALLLDLTVQALLDLLLRAQPKPALGHFRCPAPHALGDVVAIDDEILVAGVLTPEHDVGVGVIGIPMIDRHPLELGAEIPLHVDHELAGEVLEVGDLDAVFR